MSRTNSATKKASGPIPIRLPEDMKSEAEAIAKKSGLSLADILRLSIERGLPKVEEMFKRPKEQAA